MDRANRAGPGNVFLFALILSLVLSLGACGGGGGTTDNGGNTTYSCNLPLGFNMLADLNSRPRPFSSEISNTTEFAGQLYFSANSDSLGVELWRYNGTTVELVADVNPGEASSRPRDLTVMGSYLYFSAIDPVHGMELWRTDGTTTELVADIIPGVTDSHPQSFHAFNGFIYFAAYTGSGYRIHRTNGTTTEMLPGAENVSVSNLTRSVVFNNQYYFIGEINNSDIYQIWRTDGTTTEMFSQTAAAEAVTVDYYQIEFVSYGGYLYFNGNVGSSGEELVRTDGTTMELAMDIFTGGGGSDPAGFKEFNGQLYFSARTSATGYELWRTNGTTTEEVADINTGSADSGPTNLTVYNNQLYFSATEATTGREVWRTDGATTTRVTDINAGTSGSSPSYLTAYNGYLYFSANDGSTGTEVWRTDGTTTSQFADLDNGLRIQGSDPYLFFTFNNQLYFQANDGVHERELWRTDGTTTQIAFETNASIGSWSSNFENFVFSDNILYFTVSKEYDDINEYDIYALDCTTITRLGDASSGSLAEYNGQVYYAYYDDIDAHQLWRAMPTSVEFVSNIVQGDETDPDNFITFNGDLYFATDNNNGTGFWRYDGTTVTPVAAIKPNADYHIFNNQLYFTAYESATGYEVWRTDGTTTSILMDINPGSTGSGQYSFYTPQGFVNANGYMYFAANDGVNGYELWRTDGTTTEIVMDIYPGSTGSIDQYDHNPIAAGSWLYFNARNPVIGKEIWRTNGTITEYFDSINPGVDSSYPQGLIAYNNQFYFTAYNDAEGTRLYRVDDTTGPERVDQTNTGFVENSEVINMFVHNNQLYAQAQSLTFDSELWRVTDTDLIKISNFNSNSWWAGVDTFISAGDRLYVTASDGLHGRELWSLNSN